MSILQYFAKKQVGSLPNPEGALSNAQVYTKFHCFDNWHLLEVITHGLNCRERCHMRELMSFHFIFMTNFIHDKNQLYGKQSFKKC